MSGSGKSMTLAEMKRLFDPNTPEVWECPLDFPLNHLTKTQYDLFSNWKNALPPASEGATGGRLTYTFTPNNLGMIIKIEDNISKQSIDLTDYTSW